MPSNIHTFGSTDEWCAAMVTTLEKVSAEAIHRNRRFSIALSGGTTPKAMYTHWAKSRKTDWSRIHFFWSDERCVLSTHPDSNFRMAHESLLSKVNVPSSNIHRVPAEEDPMLASQQYEDEIRDFFGARTSAPPAFDVILLGLGDDGHTASLFPDTDALNVTDSWVVDNFVKKLKSHRITFSFPLINRARQVMFMVTGASKADVLADVIRHPDTSVCPAARVRPEQGEVLWFVDHSAAGKLG